MKAGRKKLLLKIAAIFIILLVALRLALPYIVLKYVNKVLSEMDGYKGHVDDIDIHLFRGAYTIKDLKIEEAEGKNYVPFVLAKTMDLSVQWRALFKRALVGEVYFIDIQLNFVTGKSTSQDGSENDWKKTVKKLFPLKINKLEVINGEVHYRDYSVSPDVNLYLRSIHGIATNLTNSDKLSKTMVAKVNADGRVMKNGRFTFNMNFDPYAVNPTFDMNAKVEKLKAMELNNFFLAYGKFDVQGGTIGLYTEAAARSGNIKGYVKPIIDNLNVLKPKEEKLGPIRFIYEAAIEGLAEIFKNHPHDRIATKVPFEGNLKDPKINIWSLLINVLKNAFVHVLLPGIDNTISLQDTGNTKISKEAKKEEKKENKKKEKEEKKLEKKKRKEAKKK